MERNKGPGCFGCGGANPMGLKLKFSWNGDEIYTDYTAPDYFEGYPGVLHGGIVSTLLDEIMANCVYRRGQDVVTAELTVRYRNPAPVKEPLRASASLLGSQHGIWRVQGCLAGLDGTVYATGEAKMMLRRVTNLGQQETEENDRD